MIDPLEIGFENAWGYHSPVNDVDWDDLTEEEKMAADHEYKAKCEREWEAEDKACGKI